MKRQTFPHAKRYTDARGKARWRYRRKGFVKQLGTAYGSEEFKRRYAEAEAEFHDQKATGAGADRTIPGSLSALVASFYKSPRWKNLSPATQRSYRGPIEYLRTRFADRAIRDLKRRDVINILSQKSETPAAANNLRKRFAQLIDHAVDLDWIKSNPVRLAKPYELAGEGFHTWDETEIARFYAVHPQGTMAHRAVTLMLYTGAARVDAVKLGPWNIKDTPRGPRIEYRRQKMQNRQGVKVSIPIHPELAELLADLPPDRPFLATAYGKARTANGLGNSMRKWCDAAGLSECSAHGLRKACATRLAEAGATPFQIMAVTGHKTLAEVQRYTESFARCDGADSAFDLLLTRPNGEQKVVNLFHRFATKPTQPVEKKGR